MEKKIDYDEILKDKVTVHGISIRDMKLCMKEAVRQAVDHTMEETFDLNYKNHQEWNEIKDEILKQLI